MSRLFRLDSTDVLKGVIIAVLASFLTSVYAIIQNGALPTSQDWKAISLASLSAGVAYLIKNLFTNSEGQIGKKDVPDN